MLTFEIQNPVGPAMFQKRNDVLHFIAYFPKGELMHQFAERNLTDIEIMAIINFIQAHGKAVIKINKHDIKIDFSDVRRGKEITYFFFPVNHRQCVEAILTNSLVTGWEIRKLEDARPILPEGMTIPDVYPKGDPENLLPDKRKAVFISYYDIDDLKAKFDELIDGHLEYLWLDAIKDEEKREQAIREAWSHDPSPLDFRRLIPGNFDEDSK